MRKWIVGLVSAVSIVAVSMGLLMSTGAPVSTSTTLSASTPDSLSEGIQVHGDWAIEVRNPDGTVAEHREFQNAFMAPEVLANLLTRSRFLAGWEIRTNGGLEPYVIKEDGLLNPSIYFGMVVPDTTTAGLVVESFSGKVKLTANYDATTGGSVNQVGSHVWHCPVPHEYDTNAPGHAGCQNTRFTNAALIPHISVEEGQTVNIEVTISFS